MICELCGKEHNGLYGSGRFCSEFCAKKFSRLHVIERTKFVKCKKCGKTCEANIHCSNNYICKECNDKQKEESKFKCKINLKNDCNTCLLKKFNFCNGTCLNAISAKIHNINKYFNLKYIGDDEKLINELLIIQNKLITDLNNGLSNNDICLKYTGSRKKGNTLLKNFNIKGRSIKESVINSIVQGKYIPNDSKKYKSCWHITWKNKKVFLRSSYELDYALYLDSIKEPYEVEYLRIKYFNTKLNEYHFAIPDFYLPNSNTIVEIKSKWTLDIQNMKDKVKAYKALGFNFKLILDKKECNNLI